MLIIRYLPLSEPLSQYYKYFLVTIITNNFDNVVSDACTLRPGENLKHMYMTMRNRETKAKLHVRMYVSVCMYFMHSALEYVYMCIPVDARAVNVMVTTLCIC